MTTEGQPTIMGDVRRYAEAYLEACKGNITGEITGTMLQFLRQEGLPPYYQFKCHLILSAADEQNEPDENLAATKHHLRKAEEAFEVVARTYTVDPTDAYRITELRKALDQEWKSFMDRKAEMHSSEEE